MGAVSGVDGYQGLAGRMLYGESLAGYTTWRVGGAAARLYVPASIDDLASFLQQTPESEPLLWVGLGSNLLVRDGGFRGTVILTHGGLQSLGLLEPHLLRAEAGVPCAKVARHAARHDLVGVEFLAGIPGTMGGALAMNAGAWGGETWARVEAVETLDRQGTLRRREAAQYQVGYRQVQAPAAEWFVAAHLRLQGGDGAAALARSRALLEQRAATQPTGQPSCGSVFRNPPGDHAARLIESAGLKGTTIGGAQVSAKHANFIVNTGGARAADIEALMALVSSEVERQHGVQLQTEVCIVGEAEA